MPELPEVETIRRHLAPVVEGRRLTRLAVRDPRWCRPLAPEALADAVVGRRVEALARRGKWLVWALEDEVHLVMHLRMTGTLLLVPQGAPPHTRVVLDLDDGGRVLFVDPRRFGTGELVAGGPALDAWFASRVGPEPLEPGFTAAALRAAFRRRTAPVKAVLLDQRRVAGVGNIYADEALFRARIHPLRPAGRLTGAQVAALRDAVVEALEAGVEAKGASIDDFRDPDGVQGTFQHRFLVHRREGEPCPACGTTIVKLVAAGRGTYVCEDCQPPPRGARVGRGGGAPARRRPGPAGDRSPRPAPAPGTPRASGRR